MSPIRTILITGAAGTIGSFLTSELARHYRVVPMDKHPSVRCYGDHAIVGDIADLDMMRAACQGIDCIIHLAANPNMEATFDQLLVPNIIGVYNVFQAASEAGCQRVVFASSVNTITGYPDDMQVDPDMHVRPPNLYGATKVWGEALARFYADQHSLSTICLRFGWVMPCDSEHLHLDNPYLGMVLTHDDLVRLVTASIGAAADIRFGIFAGVSDNRWKRLDISTACTVLGYAPVDDAYSLAERRVT
jgi:uronate dehydrogenase